MKQYTINIPAASSQPGVANIHASGKYFKISALTAACTVLTSNNDEYAFSTTASGFGDDLSPRFGALTFYNNSASINTVTFYVADSPINLPDVNLTDSVTVQTALTNNLLDCALESEIQIQATSATGAATQFTAAGTYFRRVVIIAQKSLTRGANTGNVYIGSNSARQPITLMPGDTWTLEADTGGKRDLGAWYVSADTAGDGVSIIGC